MVVINLWGAPSSGKSTVASGLFYLMKINKFSVELVNEFAKDLVWERNESVFGNQVFIFGTQYRRLQRLLDHGVQFAITDSPLPLPAYYAHYQNRPYYQKFKPLVMDVYHGFNNINYFLHRASSFEKMGRVHNEEQSLAIAKEIPDFMTDNGIDFTEVEANPRTPETILADLLKRMPQYQSQLPFTIPDETN